jgi:hypothetical protein
MNARIEGYSFSRGLDYAAIVAASEKVAWTVDEIFRGRRFDDSRPIVPASWVGIETLDFLDARDRLVLNHCRAFSYAHLLGNFEEFAPPHLGGIAHADWHADRAKLRGLLRFADEEVKHQQLFARTEEVLEESCGYAFARYFDRGKAATIALTEAMLAHSPLARCLMVLALEWGTQRHYVESVRDGGDGDALYADILRAHWLEEAQHVKSDMLEIERMAGAMSAAEIDAAFDDIAAMVEIIDAAFAGQADGEVETLERVTGRSLAGSRREALRVALHESLGRIMAGVGSTHPRFVEAVREISPSGAAKLGIA